MCVLIEGKVQASYKAEVKSKSRFVEFMQESSKSTKTSMQTQTVLSNNLGQTIGKSKGNSIAENTFMIVFYG